MSDKTKSSKPFSVWPNLQYKALYERVRMTTHIEVIAQDKRPGENFIRHGIRQYLMINDTHYHILHAGCSKNNGYAAEFDWLEENIEPGDIMAIVLQTGSSKYATIVDYKPFLKGVLADGVVINVKALIASIKYQSGHSHEVFIAVIKPERALVLKAARTESVTVKKIESKVVAKEQLISYKAAQAFETQLPDQEVELQSMYENFVKGYALACAHEHGVIISIARPEALSVFGNDLHEFIVRAKTGEFDGLS
jgi:hypothetical protein